MTPTTTNPAAEIETINLVLADLGTLRRRAHAESLTPDDFEALMGRARERLVGLRAARHAEEMRGYQTEVAQALDTAHSLASTIGRDPTIRSLMARLPGLVRASDLARTPRLPKGVNRGRAYGELVVIDGGAA